MGEKCRFCGIVKSRTEIVGETECFVFIREAIPITPGHLLILSKEHRLNDAELTTEEWADLMLAISYARGIPEKPKDGYNVGWNTGEAAGQTQMHFHAHFLPRYIGDVEHPRGGVRNMIPNAPAPKK